MALVFTFVEPDRYSIDSLTNRHTRGPASCGRASPTASRAAATTSSSMAVGVSSSPNCARSSGAASAFQPTRS
jgi:hypothetical protein